MEVDLFSLSETRMTFLREGGNASKEHGSING